MPTDKDLKRLVRARMTRTGEAYTTARARLLDKQQRKAAPPPAQPTPAPDYARLAGMTDATIEAKTGCSWERWVWALDRAGAYDWSHRAIAAHVREKYDATSWWSQTVTVGYERIKGLRAIGQRRGGEFEAGKSKVVAAPVSRLYRAFRDARTRRRWLGEVRLTGRTAVPDKSMRITWHDGTSVEVYFVAKGAAKSQVAVQHRKRADQPSVERLKEFWGERLAALQALLAPARRRRERRR
jgi:uncharacterized protein YndB with AHSA1/START domain